MTRDAVLAILIKESGYVSGETISNTLGISRAAVNKAVQTLRTQGYPIVSSTNRGYCLICAPDCLTSGDLLAFLPQKRMETVLCLEQVDSTNTRLTEMALLGAPHGQVVLANAQTNGRGRQARSFLSPKDQGIYLSMLFRPQSVPLLPLHMTAWAAVATCNAVQKVCGIRPKTKWVNDLILNYKKVGGILTEVSVEGESGHIQYIIVGIGLNVNGVPTDFPESLQASTTTLSNELGQSFSRAQLAAALIQELDTLPPSLSEQVDYLQKYRADNLTVGQKIRVLCDGTEQFGTALAITDNFCLTVQFADNTIKDLSYGEVHIRGTQGYCES